MSYDDEGDDPLKECRGTESRLALLRMFSIGNTTTSCDNETGSPQGPSRPLSAPASFVDVQEWCNNDQGCVRTDIFGEFPLTDIDRFRMMVRSPSLASIDTLHHSNVYFRADPDITGRDYEVGVEVDTNWIRDRDSGGIDATASNRYHQNQLFDSHSNIDTKSGVPLQPSGVVTTTIDHYRPIVKFASLTAASTLNLIKEPLNRTSFQPLAKHTDSETSKFVHPVFSSNFGRPELCSYDFQRVPSSGSILPDKNSSRVDTMPAATARRVENGDTVRHGGAYHHSNGRPSNNNPTNETQRNPQPVGGTNGVGEGDINPPLHNDLTVQQPTPLFERLVTEEVQELRAYVRIVENQNRRLIELERVHGDLEVRLEIESKGRQQLEATLESREREWAERLEHVERDRDHWKALVEAEMIKNSKLLDQVYRKDQDIHRMLQRKYDNEITRSTRNARNMTAGGSAATEQRDKPRNSSAAPSKISSTTTVDQRQSETANKAPHIYLRECGSAEKVRNRNAKSLLMDMFGM